MFDNLFLSNKKFSENCFCANQKLNTHNKSTKLLHRSYIQDVAHKLNCSQNPDSLNTSFCSPRIDKIQPFDQSHLKKQVEEKKKLMQQSCILDRSELNFMNQKEGTQITQLKKMDK